MGIYLFISLYTQIWWYYFCFCIWISDGSSECDIDAERCLAHRAAAQGNIELLVHAVKSDPGVLEQDDGEGI